MFLNYVRRICLGPMVDVWSYILKHVKSEETVLKIKGNLKLNPGVQIEVIKIIKVRLPLLNLLSTHRTKRSYYF